MLRLLLAVLVGVSAVQAQGAEPPGPTAGHRALLVGAAVGGGAATFPFPPAFPLGIVGGVYLAGRWLGYDESLAQVALDAAIGAGVGYAVGAGFFVYWTEVEGIESDLGLSFATVGVGAVAMAITTGLLYDGHRVEVGPAALEGGGVRLVVGL